ncbi:hypothetical protein [Paenibacillus sp. MZ03-122A]|uniref:hypothetical protein n=1 Tax=Paenibacillus sp. MZ03-122A TaxID=2962033 RepID=UPI002660098D|nr:hypothetical protein [Paenibacillus sp. MZ03-122A]
MASPFLAVQGANPDLRREIAGSSRAATPEYPAPLPMLARAVHSGSGLHSGNRLREPGRRSSGGQCP